MRNGLPIVNIGRLITMKERGRTAFGQRMFDARARSGLKQGEVTKVVPVSQGTLSGLETEAQGSVHTAAFAQLYGCDAHWLTTGEGEPNYQRQDQAETGPISLDHNPEYPAIPRVTFKLSAGMTGFEVQHLTNDADPIVFRREWFRARGLTPGDLYAVGVDGASMEPGLKNGDTVVVNTADTVPKDGVVFAVNYEGEMVIKRLARDVGDWWLCSDNLDQRRHPPKKCHADCILLGRVVHKQSEHI